MYKKRYKTFYISFSGYTFGPDKKRIRKHPGACIFTEEDPVLIFRFEQPKRAVLITEQGIITSTGTTSLDEAKELIYNVIETLKKHAIPIQPLPEILIQNYVLSMQMDNKINLDLLLPKLQQNLTIFKPDRNPWIEYLYDENTTVLIHSSGKIICTGKGFFGTSTSCFGYAFNNDRVNGE